MDARTWFTPKQKAELWERWKELSPTLGDGRGQAAAA